MPVLFHQVTATGRWHAESISGSAGALSLSPFGFASSPGMGVDHDSGSLLLQAGNDGRWALLVRRDRRLLHNGEIVTPDAGIRVLVHMDCLSLEGGEPVYFSTEETARIEPFAGSTAVTCPRCRSEVHPGQAAVKCPRCGVFHHETDDRNCFTYAPTCAVCAQPTALDAGLQWTPAAL